MDIWKERNHIYRKSLSQHKFFETLHSINNLAVPLYKLYIRKVIFSDKNWRLWKIEFFKNLQIVDNQWLLIIDDVLVNQLQCRNFPFFVINWQFDCRRVKFQFIDKYFFHEACMLNFKIQFLLVSTVSSYWENLPRISNCGTFSRKREMYGTCTAKFFYMQIKLKI